MLLQALMQEATVNPDFEGIVTNDDMVLAINHTGQDDAHPDQYAVVQNAIAGVDSQFNATTQDKTYIRAGTSTTKTATQRTIKATGDRYIGDDAQDYMFSHAVKYGTGEAVVTDYVYFNLLNGKGEKGKVSIIVNSDGSGNAGNTSEIDVDLKKVREMPEEYAYEAKSGPQGSPAKAETKGVTA